MHTLHSHLLDTHAGYHSWHDNPRHHFYHWFLFISLALFCTTNLRTEINGVKFEIFNTTAHAASTIGVNGFGQGWATFGQVVPRGVAASGLQVGNFPTQTDVKTRWGDGSIRFAIVTANITSGGSQTIASGGSAGAAFTPTWPTASVSFNIGGQNYVANLPAFSGSDSWLSGSLVRESRVMVTPAAAGQAHAFLQVVYDVRSYADGEHRLDVTVQSVKDVSAGNAVDYDVAVVLNGTTVFSKSGVSQSYLTRWRKTFGTTGFVEAAVTPDFGPFYEAKAIPQYVSSVANPSPKSTGAKFEILQFGDMNPGMSSVGGRPELAPYPNWVAQYLTHKTSSLKAYMLAHADLSGSWSGHIAEADGQSFISLDKWPNYWLDGRAGNNPTGPNAGRGMLGGGPIVIGTNWGLENAHLPSLTFVPYLVTGDRYYLDQMKFWSNFTLIWSWPGNGGAFRLGSKALLRGNQVRGQAWPMRNLADLSAYIPDADPWRNYFQSKLQNNLDEYQTRGLAPNGGPLGFVNYQPSNGFPNIHQTSTWQNAYLAWALDRAMQHGFVGGAPLRDRIVNIQIKMFTSEPDWPRIEATMGYPLIGTITNGVTTLVSTMKDWYALNKANPLDANNGVRPFAGYYGPEARMMLQIGLRQGMPGAQAALDYLNPFIAGDLNSRSGWALADDTSAPAVAYPTPVYATPVVYPTPLISLPDDSSPTPVTYPTPSPTPTAPVTDSNLAPKLISFIPNPAYIVPGRFSTLTWDTLRATSISIDQGIGSVTNVAGDVGKVVTPSVNTNYTITVTNAHGSVTKTISVDVFLRGDLNRDRIVNSLDWSAMNAKWFKSDLAADLDGNGIVNSIDFSILNKNWFKSG